MKKISELWNRPEIGVRRGVSMRLCASAIFLSCMALSSSSCSRKGVDDEVVRTRFYHPYGPELSQSSWNSQGKTGDVVEYYGSGVEVRKSYLDGQLHGAVTWSFPNSSIAQRFEEYENGKLIASGVNYENGTPALQEETYPKGLRIVRAWYEDGAPRLIEEWEGNKKLLDAKYFTDNGDVEATIISGTGTRIERSRNGVLQIREQIVQGEVAVREEFYPSGTIKYTSSYKNGQKNGISHSFTESGQPICIEQWSQGVLDGTKTLFDNGLQSAQIPYQKGQKEGIELRFRPGTDQVVAKISWHQDMRHGPSTFIFPDQEITEWYWKDGKVTEEQFQTKKALAQQTRPQ